MPCYLIQLRSVANPFLISDITCKKPLRKSKAAKISIPEQPPEKFIVGKTSFLPPRMDGQALSIFFGVRGEGWQERHWVKRGELE
jgi:hypothetical protein